ncbi:class I SAM-dependent methyltransferase [Micromonospora endophytica]|uniref:Class I SAM-dependent methyltransferase n=1 Tax=Micromonospora endophytica TaxID=515350 RepID=A0A2W2D1M4_9ACTN|nr:class I SAM-dependent methyltransferase [Micromonospora endophytica]PZF94489.1 class I SAM-dependent methyltransferase [Micromonospora endophytica]RIW43894.1 class I SAM-dependent methyltransferase [Micromonospora endophytica]BCJ56928.1 SAM-dependent methyltransferase [Micromonospora endophytica]
MNVQERINAYWTGRAPDYDAYQQRPDRFADDQAAWSRVWSAALPVAPLDVLDVGTGTGQVAMVLAGLGHRVTGIDLSEGMLAEARRHAAAVADGPVIASGDAVAPDFPAASFDAVTSRYLMWTLREPRTAVANWARLLRPGGTIAVVDSTWFPGGLDNASENFTTHYDRQVQAVLPLAAATSIDQTVAVLEEVGLAKVTVTPLTEIYELDRRYGVAPNHEHQMQYLVTGTV